MSFTTLNTTQKVFLENYLRGTGRALTSTEARQVYGIKNLRARISELRKAGLRVRREKVAHGRVSAYAVSRRDQTGAQAHIFA